MTMLTSELTTRQDLVQSLDAESIYDYLIQHGVLDEATRDKIHGEANKVFSTCFKMLSYVLDSNRYVMTLNCSKLWNKELDSETFDLIANCLNNLKFILFVLFIVRRIIQTITTYKNMLP